PSGNRAARSNAKGSARPALSLGLPRVHRAEVVRHLLDLVLGPQRAAPDHAVERALPAAAVLAVVHPHRRRVALEALGYEDVLPRRVGKAGRGRLLLLRERAARQEQSKNQDRAALGESPQWH